MKISVSIPDDVYLRAEQLAERTNRSRSRLYSDALTEYIARHGTDTVTAAMNETLAAVNEGRDAFLGAASRAILSKSAW